MFPIFSSPSPDRDLSIPLPQPKDMHADRPCWPSHDFSIAALPFLIKRHKYNMRVLCRLKLASSPNFMHPILFWKMEPTTHDQSNFHIPTVIPYELVLTHIWNDPNVMHCSIESLNRTIESLNRTYRTIKWCPKSRTKIIATTHILLILYDGMMVWCCDDICEVHLGQQGGGYHMDRGWVKFLPHPIIRNFMS